MPSRSSDAVHARAVFARPSASKSTCAAASAAPSAAPLCTRVFAASDGARRIDPTSSPAAPAARYAASAGTFPLASSRVLTASYTPRYTADGGASLTKFGPMPT